jgi:hypothetical protein
MTRCSELFPSETIGWDDELLHYFHSHGVVIFIKVTSNGDYLVGECNKIMAKASIGESSVVMLPGANK